MNLLSGRSLDALLTLTLCSVTAMPALAVDPLCKQLLATGQTLKTIPVHIYMTETETFSNQTMAKTAGQIGMGGTKQSEEISTTKTIYVTNDGKWVDMQMSFAAMEEDKDSSDSDIKEAIEKSTCKALPDETMYGQPARVYTQSTPELGIDKKLWISKTTNLLIRSDMTNNAGTMKIFTVSRYEYSGVQAPAHAITMQDMVKSRNGN